MVVVSKRYWDFARATHYVANRGREEVHNLRPLIQGLRAVKEDP